MDARQKMVLLVVREVSSRLSTVDNSLRISTLVAKNGVNGLAEGIVVDEIGNTSLVFVNERINLLLSELDLKGAKASAEL